jgi:hypothetical protein
MDKRVLTTMHILSILGIERFFTHFVPLVTDLTVLKQSNPLTLFPYFCRLTALRLSDCREVPATVLGQWPLCASLKKLHLVSMPEETPFFHIWTQCPNLENVIFQNKQT